MTVYVCDLKDYWSMSTKLVSIATHFLCKTESKILEVGRKCKYTRITESILQKREMENLHWEWTRLTEIQKPIMSQAFNSVNTSMT